MQNPHIFQYPKVTPVAGASGTPPKASATGTSGAAVSAPGQTPQR
jgi:hypothetical protein